MKKILIPIALMIVLMAACGSKDADRVANDSVRSSYIYAEGDEWQTQYARRIEKNVPNGRRIKVRRWGNLAQIFNDSNRYQYAYAEQLGIKPISHIGETYMCGRPIVKVQTCQYYYIDTLTHSLPYLVPEAELLLRDIGRNFIDSLAARGADSHRIRVTSLLRTEASVKKLRRINRNATDSSTHKFGTTFDISWSQFDCTDSTRTINGDDLKWLLAEVLEDLRQQGRCLIKYERKSPCYHITAIK